MDEEIFLIDGRPVHELKVVELRKELEQRNLPKSGNKKELVDRLFNYLREEHAEQDRQQHQQNEQQNEQHTEAVAPDPSITDMVAQYLAQQQIQLEAARRDADKHRASTSSTEDQSADMVQQKESSSPEKMMPEMQPIAGTKDKEAAASGNVQQVAAEFIPEEPNAIPKNTTIQSSVPQSEERDEERIDGDSEAEEPAHRRSASSSDTSTDAGEELDENKTSAIVQNEAEMEEEIGQSDARNKVDDQQYEEQATERIEDDDRQMLEETMEETGSGEFVPDEPTGRKESKLSKESLQSTKTKLQQTVESSTKSTTTGDEELDFEQEVDEDEVNGNDEDDEEERGEPDDRGRKRQLQASTPSPTSSEYQKPAKQLQDSQTTTTESGMEAVGIVDGGRVEIVSNVPTTITAKQELSTEQLSGGFGRGRHNSFEAGGHRRSSAAAGEIATTVEQQASFEEFTPEGFKRRRPVSPARQDVSRWIHIRGLKRPFTNRGLLELLSKFGTVDTDVFWIDQIKSNCIVTFETAEEAKLAREGLHNVVWPVASDGHLIVEYSSEEKLNRRKAEDQLPPVGAIDRKLNGGIATACMPPLPLAPPLMGRGGFGGMEGGMMEPSTQGGLGLTIVVDNRASDSFGPQVHIQHDKGQMRDVENRKRKAEELEKSQNTLDQLFKKTKTQPHIYFLPLTSEEVAKRYKNKSAISSSSNYHKSNSGHRDVREGDNRHGHHHSASSSSAKGRSSGRDGHPGERDRGDRERRSGRR